MKREPAAQCILEIMRFVRAELKIIPRLACQFCLSSRLGERRGHWFWEDWNLSESESHWLVASRLESAAPTPRVIVHSRRRQTESLSFLQLPTPALPGQR